MQFKVHEWMIDLVVFIDPEATVSEALAMMRRRYIQSIIVQKTSEQVYGIVTSRDISDKIVAMDRNPSGILVKEIMTSPVITVSPDLSLKECATLMRDKNIHHLPVADSNGMIIGMIAAADFLVAAEAMGRSAGEKLS
ncbi:MAG: CBS domain-containing protein [Anaerolineaceae bacterium]|nr:CBS domain-containing protein [Anaerolineaceae bacterium]